ncbi:YKOJ [Clostridiaceae bacterium BL-3]|nr:YKOJ [Clostridiaceae bacterium BL-3]
MINMRCPFYNNLWDNYWRQYRISAETAVQIALQRVPGQVLRVEVDTEDGLLVYEVYIRTTSGIIYEVTINANTGEILDVDRQND